jgi:hypothetical protein
MKRIINGQEFTSIEYTNHGAHAPLQTWYPTVHLASLDSDWREIDAEPTPAEAGLIQPEAAGPGVGDLADELAKIEGLLFEARSDIPEGDRARRDVTTALGMVRGLMAGVAAAKPEPAAVDWAVVGPKMAVALEGAHKALRVALPHCPSDEEHNGDAVFVGEWLDEVNEVLAFLPRPALTTSQQIRVRGCQIVCDEHPEWGTWGVMEDKGEYFEIHGDRGGRVLFKSEADQSWSIISA